MLCWIRWKCFRFISNNKEATDERKLPSRIFLKILNLFVSTHTNCLFCLLDSWSILSNMRDKILSNTRCRDTLVNAVENILTTVGTVTVFTHWETIKVFSSCFGFYTQSLLCYEVFSAYYRNCFSHFWEPIN